MPDLRSKGYFVDCSEVHKLLHFLFFIIFFSYSSLLQALDDPTVYSLSAIGETELEVEVAGQEIIKVAVDTDGLQHELQGGLPITFILEPEQATFENGEKTLLWHSKALSVSGETGRDVDNSSAIYINFEITEELSNKKMKIFINREEDISRLASMAAFIPQMLPFLLPGNVKWKWNPLERPMSYFYYMLIKWNYKVFEGDIIKLARDSLLTPSFNKKKPLLAQCTADTIEGLLLFKSANYGEKTLIDEDGVKTKKKFEVFRNYIMVRSIKKFIDCTSSTVAELLFEIQVESEPGWQRFREMNQESIHGLSKIMVGLTFNTFAYESGDFLKQARLLFNNYPESQYDQLREDLDRSLVKAVQYTLQSGYEDFLKGQLKEYGFNESYAVPMATAAGIMELLWRINHYINISGNGTPREIVHQLNSLVSRAEAMSLSLTKTYLPSHLSGKQLIAIGTATPALVSAVILAASRYTTPPFLSLFDAVYDGLIIGMLSYFITPALQDYGVWAFKKFQKPILDFLNSGSNSWSKYLMADDIRYRVTIAIE